MPPLLRVAGCWYSRKSGMQSIQSFLRRLLASLPTGSCGVLRWPTLLTQSMSLAHFPLASISQNLIHVISSCAKAPRQSLFASKVHERLLLLTGPGGQVPGARNQRDQEPGARVQERTCDALHEDAVLHLFIGLSAISQSDPFPSQTNPFPWDTQESLVRAPAQK